MHYKNGREAKNGDVVVYQPDGWLPKVGILYDARAGNDYCNGKLAIPQASDPMPNLKECLHVDDAIGAAAKPETAQAVTVEAKARAAFAAYNAEGPNPNKTWDGKDVPPWEGLNDQVRGKWLAAAKALVVLAVFAPALAFAQGDALPSPPKTALEFVVSLLPGVFTLLSIVLIKFLFPMLSTWLTALAQKSNVAAVALKVEHFAETVVADLDATMRPEIALALADGVLDDAEKAKLRAVALDRIKVLLGTAGLAEVSGVLGIGASAVETYLSGVLEKQVDAKNNAAAAATPVAAAALVPKPA